MSFWVKCKGDPKQNNKISGAKRRKIEGPFEYNTKGIIYKITRFPPRSAGKVMPFLVTYKGKPMQLKALFGKIQRQSFTK